ncbi:integrase, catalytic region, zinc finger, CCHC-type containing protein [Tanacetum coccineum]
MSEKAKDLEIIDKNISHKPIDYEKLNRLSEDFGKRFSPQQEMDTEQAFWLRISNLTSKPSGASPIKIEAPKELPKVSLVNESLKKLKYPLARFNNVVKIRTTPDARTEDLLNEIMEVQTVFNQMDAAVQQFLVDKKCLKITKKELLLENDRLLQQIMSQYVLLTVMNSMSWLGESVNVDGKTQLQDKDSTICKLKDIIKSSREKSKEENVNYDYCEIETKNVDMENSVAKLLSENKRLHNEINHVKQGKEIVDITAQTPSAHTIVPGMFKLYLEHLAPRLLENKEIHIEYLKYTQEQADILQGLVKQAKAKQPLEKELDFACCPIVPSGIETMDGIETDPAGKVYYFKSILQVVDLLSGSRDINLYTISLDDMLKTSPICLLSKASKTKLVYGHHSPVITSQLDNGTEFVNQTLREFYENVGISHQTSVASTPL